MGILPAVRDCFRIVAPRPILDFSAHACRWSIFGLPNMLFCLNNTSMPPLLFFESCSEGLSSADQPRALTLGAGFSVSSLTRLIHQQLILTSDICCHGGANFLASE